MKRAALIALLALAAPVWAEPPAPSPTPPAINIPAEIPSTPGQWLVVTPNTNCTAVVYVGLDGLSAFPSGELKDPRKLVVQPPAGRFRFVAVGTLNDQLATANFVITDGGPGPPPPPPPADRLGLTRASANGLAAVPLTSRQLSAAKLAVAHRAVRADLLGDKYAAEEKKGPDWLAEAVLNAKREANRAALAAEAANWKPWAASVDSAVTVLYQDGRLKTRADWAEALGEIAAGLGG
jgi:hypothetical protein